MILTARLPGFMTFGIFLLCEKGGGLCLRFIANASEFSFNPFVLLLLDHGRDTTDGAFSKQIRDINVVSSLSAKAIAQLAK